MSIGEAIGDSAVGVADETAGMLVTGAKLKNVYDVLGRAIVVY